MLKVKKIRYDDLVGFVKNVLTCAELDEFSIESVTTGLCETSLRGVDSHGVRLLPHYVNSALNGRKNTNPDFRFQKTFPSLGHLDADDAFGHAAGMKAIELGIEMAQEQGVGVVAVSNSSHPGAMASMALRAARKGFMAFAFTHADALVLSYGSTRPFFGTNPVCLAAPRKGMEPYCLDMATSKVPWNRVLIHRNAPSYSPLDPEIAVNQDGHPTTDPDEARALLPTGGYKGYGLASMVDVLCGVYTGMAFGRSIPSMYGAKITETRKLGQFYMVLRVDGVTSQDAFMESMRQMTEEVRAEPKIGEDDVVLPGDKEIAEAKNRSENGVPLDDATVTAFEELSKKFSVELKLVNDT